MKSIFVFLFITFLAADIPPGYYDYAEGLDGDSLRLALHNIIDDHNAQSYSSLHVHFESTDAKPDGTTTIRFNIPVETRHPSTPLGNHAVSIQIIDITGHKVETMMNETVEAGKHEIKWNASPYASGIYFAVLQSGNKSASEKIIYIK